MATRRRTAAATAAPEQAAPKRRTGGTAGWKWDSKPSVEAYEKAWAAYRLRPELSSVAEALGCRREIAQRVVDGGMPSLGLEPLRKRLATEARVVASSGKRLAEGLELLDAEKAARVLDSQRAAAEKALAKEREVLGDALASREEELRLVRVNRHSALAIAGLQARLLKSADMLADMLERSIEEVRGRGLTGEAAMKALGLRHKDVVAVVARISTIAERTAATSNTALEMERLIMGEPTKILGIKSEHDGARTDTERAEQFLQEAARIIASRKRRQEVIDAEVVENEESPAGDGGQLLDHAEPEGGDGGEAAPE